MDSFLNKTTNKFQENIMTLVLLSELGKLIWIILTTVAQATNASQLVTTIALEVDTHQLAPGMGAYISSFKLSNSSHVRNYGLYVIRFLTFFPFFAPYVAIYPRISFQLLIVNFLFKL